MKKINYFVILCLFLLLITGCGEKKNELTPIETSKNVNAAINNLNTYKVNVQTKFSWKENNQKEESNYIANVDVDRINKKLKANFSNDESSSEAFISFDSENKVLNYYYKLTSSEEWDLVSLEFNEEIENYYVDIHTLINDAIKKITDKLFSFDSLKQVSASKNNYNYEVVITKNEISNILKEVLEKYIIVDYEDIDTYIETILENIDGSIKVKFSIDKESNYFTSIDIDLEDFLNKTLNKNGEKKEYSKAQIIFSFDGFNKQFDYKEPTNTIDRINIARQSAIEDGAYGIRKAAQLQYVTILLDEPEGLASAITFACDGISCSAPNGSKIEIDGVIPTSGTITISPNGDVTFTGIVINGFLCDIPSEGEIICVQ